MFNQSFVLDEKDQTDTVFSVLLTFNLTPSSQTNHYEDLMTTPGLLSYNSSPHMILWEGYFIRMKSEVP